MLVTLRGQRVNCVTLLCKIRGVTMKRNKMLVAPRNERVSTIRVTFILRKSLGFRSLLQVTHQIFFSL